MFVRFLDFFSKFPLICYLNKNWSVSIRLIEVIVITPESASICDSSSLGGWFLFFKTHFWISVCYGQPFRYLLTYPQGYNNSSHITKFNYVFVWRHAQEKRISCHLIRWYFIIVLDRITRNYQNMEPPVVNIHVLRVLYE
jgi:hypothetical protein